MSVVVITRRADPTADLVVTELQHRGVAVFRADLAEFPEQLGLTARLTNQSTSWRPTLRTARRAVDFSDVTGVWYRKPTEFGFPAGMTVAEHRWCAAEAKIAFGGALSDLPGVRWINPPHASAAAEPRPRQLATAADCGLAIPDSLITNEPQEARAFCHEHAEHGVIYKPLTSAPTASNGDVLALYAAQVDTNDISGDVAHTAHLFQARVPCSFSARIVAVEGRLIASRIDAPGHAVDWRAEHDQLAYSPLTIPEPVAAGLRRMMTRYGLAFCSSDWIITPDGTWTFIGDLNPVGQWAWIPHLREPVTHALADALTLEDTA